MLSTMVRIGTKYDWIKMENPGLVETYLPIPGISFHFSRLSSEYVNVVKKTHPITSATVMLKLIKYLILSSRFSIDMFSQTGVR
jgi:hypothetical protein